MNQYRLGYQHGYEDREKERDYDPGARQDASSDAVMTVAEMEELPTGSIIIDNGVPDAPAVACKTGYGDWQVLGGDPERRWWSEEMFPDDHSQSFVVVYNPGKL